MEIGNFIEGKPVGKIKIIKKNGEVLDPVKWDGNPLYLNQEKSSGNDIATNILFTLIRCPQSVKFYEQVYGEEKIEQIKKILEETLHQ